MRIVREQAMADVDARVISKELKSFDDVHKVIKPAVSPGEYRYGEEFEGDFPRKGERWVTTVDERERQADLDNLAGLPSLLAASPLEDALVNKAAARIFDNIGKLKIVGAQVVAGRSIIM